MTSNVSDARVADNPFRLMWDKAARDFEEKTGRKLSGTKFNDPHSLVKQFQDKLAPEENDTNSSRRKEKAAKVVGFVLSFVETIGGLASGVASVLFGGPADICFNAFSFLINIPKKIGKVYDDLTKLFSEMSSTILEFQVLQQIQAKNIEGQLLKTTHDILIAFVNICGRYIKFLDGGKRHHLTVAFRSVFLDDDCGVLDELRNFQTLARQQSQMVGTISLKHIFDIEEAIKDFGSTFQELREGQQKISGGVDILLASDAEQKNKIIIQKSLSVIEEKLRIGRSTAKELLNDLIQQDIFDGACQWIYDAEDYKTWIDPASKDHMLCLAGRRQSGKKSLLTAIARKLKMDTPAPNILYYAFPSTVGKRSSEKDESLSLVLKFLALQNAQYNVAYAKKLEKSLNHADTFEERDFAKMWKALEFAELLGSSDKQTYILLCGLDQLNTDKAKELLNFLASPEEKKSKMTKVLVTGLPDVFDGLDVPPLILYTADHNQTGLSRFIEWEMSKIEVLQEDHESIKKLRDALLAELPRKVKGNFFTVAQKLARVNAAIDENKSQQDVLDVLDDDVNTDSEILVRKKIKDLERSLNPDDIEDLNIILPWLIYGRIWPTVDHLESILRMHKRNTAVMPLRKRLERKYPTIIRLDEQLVILDGDVSSFLERTSDQEKKEVDIDSKISLRIDIDGAKKENIKRFFWDLTERFNFENSLLIENEADDHRSKISSNQVDAHFTIADEALQFLGEESECDSIAMLEYSLEYLPYHLIQVANSELPFAKKKTICRKLISFFSDAEVLGDKWTSITAWQLEWIELETCRVIENLFIATEKEERFELIERRWIAKNIKVKDDRGAFWQPITVLVARNWLSNREWDAAQAYRWIDSFLVLQSTPRNQSEDSSHTDDASQEDDTVADPERTTLETETKIMRAAAWSAKHAGVDATNALYHERIASTFFSLNEYDKAIEYFGKALALSDASWRVHKYLASIYEQKDMYKESQEELKAAIDDPRFAEAEKDSKQKEEFVSLLLDLASTEDKNNEKEAALKHYQQALELDPSQHMSFWSCFHLLCQAGETERAGRLLCGKQETDTTVATNMLSERLKNTYGYYESIDPQVGYWLKVIMETPEFATQMQKAFDQIVREAGNDYTTKAYYIFNNAFICINSDSEDLRQKGMQQLEECVRITGFPRRGTSGEDEFSSGDFWSNRARILAIKHLALWRSLDIIRSGLDHPLFDKFANMIKNAPDVADVEPYNRYSTVLTYLCRHYTLAGKYDQAREVVKKDIQDALVILEDSDPENDGIGLRLLSEALKLSGDDLNSLTAWSLCAPKDLGSKITIVEKTDDDDNANTDQSTTESGNETKIGSEAEENKTDGEKSPTPRTGPISQLCDGCRVKDWTYADELWSCKYCPDVQFCTPCHSLLKKGQLKRLVCHREHDFLYIPPWSDEEYLEIGPEQVRVGGELDAQGLRVGGTTQSVKEWFADVRKIWNIEPPAPATPIPVIETKA